MSGQQTMRDRLRGMTGECQVLAGPVLSELPQLIGDARTLVITDSVVRRLHGASFPPGEVIEIGLGESAKSLDALSALFQRFLDLGVDSDAVIVAVGGGVVCDLAGFAAATWLRGVRAGLVPTTLLAQVDASLGGKNGVNFGGLKNLVGTIRQPSFVLCDPMFLQTLPDAELSNGLAEVVKAAVVRDCALFEFLETHADALRTREPDALHQAVRQSIRVKLEVVRSDELGRGERVVLNFGHTLGHAIEAVTGMRHGEAVSIGMVFAARLSADRGLLPSRCVARIESVLQSFGLPTTADASASDLVQAVRQDKKRSGSIIRMALLQEIGDAIVESVEVDELELAIANLR